METNTQASDTLTIRRVRPILDEVHWSMYGEWPPPGHDYSEQLPYLRFFLERPAPLAPEAAHTEEAA